MAEPILLAGISVRMLAELAVKAGYAVVALDYFGDADLQALCPGLSLLRDFGGSYSPAALVDAAGDLLAPTIVYSASLENHPLEVERLARGRRLLGNSPETLWHVRDPVLLAAALDEGGFAFPETLSADEAAQAKPGQSWLLKPLRSGGGHGIHSWRGGELPAQGVLQRRVVGMSGSATFVADGERAVLLGLTEQLVGRRIFGARHFRYCGNLLPPRLPRSQLQTLTGELRAIAELLTDRFELRGLGGIDFVWDGERAWVLEVNPRPTAALELIDTAYNIRTFDTHLQAFDGLLPTFELEQVLEAEHAAGKAIVYAERDVTLGPTAGWAALGRRDIPDPGETIQQGHPICTLVVEATGPSACLRELRARAEELKREIYG